MKRYWVTVVRYGGAEVEAENEHEAMKIVNEKYRTQDINWSDDWDATDADEEVE